MARVSWSDEALRNVDGIVDYIEQFNENAARNIADRLFALGESLRDFPHRGRRTGRGLRELTTVPPFILSSEVRDGIVTILNVRHSARRPPE